MPCAVPGVWERIIKCWINEQTYLNQALLGQLVLREGSLVCRAKRGYEKGLFYLLLYLSHQALYQLSWKCCSCTFPDHIFPEMPHHKYYTGNKASKIVNPLTRMSFIWPRTWAKKSNPKPHGILKFGVSGAEYFVICLLLRLKNFYVLVQVNIEVENK